MAIAIHRCICSLYLYLLHTCILILWGGTLLASRLYFCEKQKKFHFFFVNFLFTSSLTLQLRSFLRFIPLAWPVKASPMRSCRLYQRKWNVWRRESGQTLTTRSAAAAAAAAMSRRKAKKGTMTTTLLDVMSMLHRRMCTQRSVSSHCLFERRREQGWWQSPMSCEQDKLNDSSCVIIVLI